LAEASVRIEDGKLIERELVHPVRPLPGPFIEGLSERLGGRVYHSRPILAGRDRQAGQPDSTCDQHANDALHHCAHDVPPSMVVAAWARRTSGLAAPGWESVDLLGGSIRHSCRVGT